ncbi:MAG: GNAT family N-acetyltransferase [Halobacterium sp.]
MVDVRRVPSTDFEDVYRLLCSRVGERDRDAVTDWYDDYPALFVGAYDDGDLVGFALGRRAHGGAELVGIGVTEAYTRRGIGSRLLDAFEAGAVDLGVDRVSVGSAGGYVDEFYVGNGYRPESILVRTTRDALPADYRARFDVLREREDGDAWKVYIAPGGSEDDPLDRERVERVRRAFDDPDANYVMEKPL